MFPVSVSNSLITVEYAPKIELETKARTVMQPRPINSLSYQAVQLNGAFTMALGLVIGFLSIHASLLLDYSIALQLGSSCKYSISWTLPVALTK